MLTNSCSKLWQAWRGCQTQLWSEVCQMMPALTIQETAYLTYPLGVVPVRTLCIGSYNPKIPSLTLDLATAAQLHTAGQPARTQDSNSNTGDSIGLGTSQSGLCVWCCFSECSTILTSRVCTRALHTKASITAALLGSHRWMPLAPSASTSAAGNWNSTFLAWSWGI